MVKPEEIINENEEEDIEDIDSDIIGTEEARAKASLMLADKKNPEMLSELEGFRVPQVAILKAIANKLDQPLLAEFVNDYLLLQVSKNRKGREEIIEVATGGYVPEKKKKGFFGFLKGGAK